MKILKLLYFLVVFIVSTTLHAQAPQLMNYQAVIRNASNALITNQSVGVKISILQGTVSGTEIFSEQFTSTTNANGLLTLQIGSGTPITGTLSSINWANGPYFIKIQTDPSGGNAYSLTSTSQLLSVPYALFAGNVNNGITGTGTTNYLPKFTPSGTVLGNSQVFDDATNVGIGTATPTYKLDVLHGGSTGIRSKSSASYSVVDIDAINGDAALRFYKIGSMKWNTRNRPTDDFYEIYQGGGSGGSRMVISQAGNMGISANNPIAKLEVNGFDATNNNYTSESGFNITNGLAVKDKISTGMTNKMGVYSYVDGATGENIAIFAETGVSSSQNDGILARVSTAPAAGKNSYALHAFDAVNAANTYAASLNGKVQIIDGTQAAGKVLTSDAVGNASWQNVITPKVSFKAYGASGNISNFYSPITNWAIIEHEEGGSNFTPATGTYTIPVTGLYSIDAAIVYNAPAANGYAIFGMEINSNLNSIEYTMIQYFTTVIYASNSFKTTKLLTAGDKIQIVNYSITPISFSNFGPGIPDTRSTRFSITLLH